MTDVEEAAQAPPAPAAAELDVREGDLQRKLPELSELIRLFGPAKLIAVLRESGLERPIFQGFRPSPSALLNPIIRRRLTEALPQKGVLENLSEHWRTIDSPLREAVETSPPDEIPSLAASLIQTYGRGRVAWALLLHPNPEVRNLAPLVLDANGAAIPGAAIPGAAIPAASIPGADFPEPTAGSAPEAPNSADRQQGSPIPVGGAAAALPHELPHELPDESEERRAETEQAEGRAQRTTPDLSGETEVAVRLREELQQRDEEMEGLRREAAVLRQSLSERQDALAKAHKQEEEASQETTALRKSAEELRRRVKQLEQTADSAARQAERYQKKLDEATRRADSAEKTLRRETRRQAGELAPAPTPSAPARALRPQGTERVIDRLLEKGRYEAVIEYAREAWEIDPGHPLAQDWLLKGLEGAGKRTEIARFHYDAAMRLLSANQHAQAIRELCESIRAAPDSSEAAWTMERLLQTADPTRKEDIAEVARLYGELRRRSADAAATFESLGRRVRRSLWRRLPSMLSEEHKRTEILWKTVHGTGTLTAQELAAAVSSGDAPLVERFRTWAASQHGEQRQAAIDLIEGSNSLMPGARKVLTHLTRPVVVDGSNVAWFGQSDGGRPDLENIRQVRQKLFEEGYFPVVILADAPLVWQVRDAARLQRWQVKGDIRVVEGRTYGDEVLLEEARARNCPIVTNDRMRDVDPARRTPRIRFTIGPGGVTLEEED